MGFFSFTKNGYDAWKSCTTSRNYLGRWELMKLLIKWLLSAVALLMVTYLYSGVQVSSFGSAMIAALVIGLGWYAYLSNFEDELTASQAQEL